MTLTTLYQLFEVASDLWRYQSLSGTFNISWACVWKKQEQQEKTTNTLKKAVNTTQQYNKNLLDKSVSEEIICWLLCDVKVIALEENKPCYELQ